MNNFFGNKNSFSFSSFIDKQLFGFAIFVITEKICLKYVNDYLLELLEYSKEEISNIINDNITEIINSPSINVIYDTINLQITEKNAFETKICISSKSNKKLLFSIKGISKIENNYLNLHIMLINETTTIDHIDTLERRANHDSLTGLFNRGTTKNAIENYLSNFAENTKSAFIILDIDNFKKINDTYGHLQGDALLIDLADSINKIAYKSSINGRYGGDEFIIFLKDIPYKEFASGQIQKILESTTYATRKKLKNDSITFSAGISFLPDDALSFNTLFKIADAALYFAKAEGKNTVVSSDELNNNDILFDHSDNRDHNDNNLTETGNQFVEYSFNLLYRSTYLHSAIKLLFSVIGRQFKFNKISIFENKIETGIVKTTHEWHSNESKHYIKKFDNIPIEFCSEYLYKHLQKKFEYEILEINDVEKKFQELFKTQGVQYMLVYPLIDEDENVYGFIGFFNFENRDDLSTYQKTVLKEISNVINSFLRKEMLKKQIYRLKLKLGEVDENIKHII